MSNVQTEESASARSTVFTRSLVAEIISNLTLAKYQIQTAVSFLLLAKMEEWLESGYTGALVYAWFRLGKTCGCLWVLKKLSDFLGYHIGFIHVNCRDGLPDERQKFFRYLLENTGNQHILQIRGEDNIRTAFENFIIAEAKKSPVRTFIVFFDEAQQLIEEQYGWMREVDNAVTKAGCRQFTLYEGDNNLRKSKEYLIDNGKEQVVTRNMIGEFVYRGLESGEHIIEGFRKEREAPEAELVEVLEGLVSLETDVGSGLSIRAIYKMAGGIVLDVPSLGKKMWAEFASQWRQSGLGELELAMAYLCISLSRICSRARKKGWVSQPSADDIKWSIDGSGFHDCIAIRRKHRTAPPHPAPIEIRAGLAAKLRVKAGANVNAAGS